uniref:hypothetical protein n=1 Tax=Clostridium sp. 12(A) TaxID=1163671 RepID=UPI0004650082|nr:hypothetical protein [Clostridium sp. 12(A)]
MENFLRFEYYRALDESFSYMVGDLKDRFADDTILLSNESGKWSVVNKALYSAETRNIVEEEVEKYFDNKRNEVIRLILEEDFLPLNIQIIREDSGFKTAMYEMIQEGTLRFRNCEGAAVELNEA